MTLQWKVDGAREVAYSNDAAVGAVFPSVGRRTRWRAWVTVNMNPVEGTEKTAEEARAEVRQRFAAFCLKAGLVPSATAAALATRTLDYVGRDDDPDSGDRFVELRHLAKAVVSLSSPSNEAAKSDEGAKR